jgi:hypothetical protein
MRPSPPLQLDASTIVGSLPRLRIQATRPLPAAEQEPDIGVPLGTKPSGRVHERDTPGRDGLQRTVGDGSGEGGYSLFYPFGKIWGYCDQVFAYNDFAHFELQVGRTAVRSYGIVASIRILVERLWIDSRKRPNCECILLAGGRAWRTLC